MEKGIECVPGFSSDLYDFELFGKFCLVLCPQAAGQRKMYLFSSQYRRDEGVSMF